VGILNNPISRAIEAEKTNQTTRFQQQDSQAKSTSRKGTFRSLVSLFVNFFKILQHIILFPEKIIVKLFSRSRWTAQGRTILITGASSGIGAEMARQYALEGAKLALVARTTENLDRVEQECRELGASKVIHYSADLSNSTSTQLAMKQAIKDFGKFDIVVLNAGRCQGCYFEEIKDPQQIDQMIKLNFNGSVTCLHYLLPHIPKSNDSRIVVISNTAGIVAAPYQSIYSGTKHALTGFSNSLRIELGNTYGTKSPKVCLVNFPEISGTKINAGRMDMGAKLPPAKWYQWVGKPLPHAVHELLPAIAAGKRDFGQPSKFNIYRSLYTICPGLVDYWVMKNIQRTHYRPIDESVKQRRTAQNPDSKVTPNRSWAN
jgi:short-subunit dehydrogenase